MTFLGCIQSRTKSWIKSTLKPYLLVISFQKYKSGSSCVGHFIFIWFHKRITWQKKKYIYMYLGAAGLFPATFPTLKPAIETVLPWLNNVSASSSTNSVYSILLIFFAFNFFFECLIVGNIFFRKWKSLAKPVKCIFLPAKHISLCSPFFARQRILAFCSVKSRCYLSFWPGGVWICTWMFHSDSHNGRFVCSASSTWK